MKSRSKILAGLSERATNSLSGREFALFLWVGRIAAFYQWHRRGRSWPIWWHQKEEPFVIRYFKKKLAARRYRREHNIFTPRDMARLRRQRHRRGW